VTRLGVIEGFYGRPWEPHSRLRMLEWLARLGFDGYLYAPKADASLRRRWRDPMPPAHRLFLGEVAREGRAAGLRVSVGLSPFALYLRYDARAREALRARVQELVDCGFGGLALLFDDMPGDHEALAERQAEIAVDVASWAPGLHLHICPTYYSEDSVLDKVFGERPPRYLEALGERLPAAYTPFWTGAEVCAAAIRRPQAAAVVSRWQRPVALWDNYPVNDSRTRSEHLYLGAVPRREETPSMGFESHWCNAMNQAALSLPALASLPVLYGRSGAEVAGVLAEAGIDDRVRALCMPLAETGRSGLAAADQRALAAAAPSGSLAASELDAWLRGEYTFDPACLTD